MRIAILLTVVLLPLVAHAQVAHVVDFISSSVTVFERSDGGSKTSVKKNEIKLPAAQLSNPSKYGLIKVEFHYVDASKDRLIGWVKRSSVETDVRRDVDVVSDCGTKSLVPGGSNAHGTRGLGGC